MPLAPRIQLRSRVAGIEKREGALVVPDDYCVLATGDVDIFKPDGSPLLFLRRKAIPEGITEECRSVLRHVATHYGSSNRSKYAGSPRFVKVDADGKKRKNSHAMAVDSAIIGFMDRMGGRFPFCRPTAFTANEVESWEKVVPLAQFVARAFAENVPARYKAQKLAADAVPPEYVVKGTPFTTLTVNHNIAGRIHTDKGDFAAGFGCITCFRQGTYRGGVLAFPAFRVAVDLEDRDLIFFDPHEFHGVTDFTDTEEGYERITVVYYFRESMAKCLPAAAELKRAKERGSV